MTTKSSSNYRRSHSSRPPRPSVRSSNYAPFGSASTRPPSNLTHSGAYESSSQASPTSAPQASPAQVIDEALWFSGHDQAVAEDTAARSMAALVGRIIGAKPFPVSARRLADLTRQDVVRIEPVIQVLETDPGLSARLLRLVNSAGYALRQRCTSVRHAATLVGTDRLHQIATTAAVLDLFDSKGPAAAQIIEHSTEVGAFCRYLGAHLALPVDDLFTAGFLHDIGKLMLMETEGEQYIELLAQCGSQPDCIHHLERRLYGFDHAALAAHVLTAWNIPDPVPKIVAWHHEPAHAYKVSSVMAAPVQTIRLSDAIVYAMRNDVDRTCIKELAQHEAAGYLDISEPQLAAMWDELRVLFDESHQQCLGDNAPALDPRSLKPKQPMSIGFEAAQSEKAHDLPKQFPCVECGCPTFGNTCPACGGYVCPEHQIGNDEWCTICARDYKSERRSTPVPIRAKWAFGALSAAVLLSGLLGMFTAGGSGAIRAGVGTLLLGALIALLYLVGKIWFVRTRFVRSRPNRAIAEPQLNDGGTQSLVPAQGPDSDEDERAPNVANWAQAKLHFVEPLKEITIREISGSQPASERDIRLPPNATVVTQQSLARVHEAATSSPMDPLRLQQQGQSLVTLPAPSNSEVATEPPTAQDLREPAGTPRRLPRDTLREQDLAARQGEYALPSRALSEAADEAFESYQSKTDVRTFRKTDPGPEAFFNNPYDTLHDAPGELQCAEDALVDVTGATQMDLSRIGLQATDPVDADVERGSQIDVDSPSHESEIVTIVRPILSVEAEPPSSSDCCSTKDSVSASQDHADDVAQSIADCAVEPLDRLEQTSAGERGASPSFHPLAVLGIQSQPPCMAPIPEPEEPQETVDLPDTAEFESTREAPPSEQGVEAPIVAESESAPQVCALEVIVDAPVDTESETAPAAPPLVQDNATPSAIDEALVRSLAGDLAKRFGDEFEVRVRELVAQRVAEMVTERLLAALDVNSLGLQLKDSLSLPDQAAAPTSIRETANGSIKKKRAGSRKA